MRTETLRSTFARSQLRKPETLQVLDHVQWFLIRQSKYFAALQVSAMVVLAYYFSYGFGLVTCAFLFYLLPPFLWRLYSFLFPVQDGLHILDLKSKPCSWLLVHRLQTLCNLVPWVERLLLCVPGLYSAWLRLWGSEIGQGVTWTSEVQVRDRSHLVVGDEAFFGYQVCLSSHVIVRRKDGRMMLFLKKPVIGKRALVGAWSIVGPGAEVLPGARVPVRSMLDERKPLA